MPILNWPQPDEPPREDSVKHPIWRAPQPRPTRSAPPIMSILRGVDAQRDEVD